MPLHWHIEGKRVKLNDDFEATLTAQGGYEQLTASCDREEVKQAHQGDTIAAELSNGKEVWYGTLDSTPAISRHPIAKITATGPVSRARRTRGNRLYQSRDYGLWAAITADPHNINAIGTLNVKQSITADTQTGRFMWTIPNGTDIKQLDANGVCAWFMGEAVTRIAFDWAVDTGTSNYALRVFTGNGPSGTLAQRGADQVSGAGASGSVDLTLAAGNDDMVCLVYTRTGANATTASNTWLRVGNVRVNGRAPGDDFSPGGILADLGQTLGWSTKDVNSSGQNALPSYWTGGSWGDYIDELATLDDWPWLVTRGALHYGPWTTRWALRFGQEHEDIDWPPLYNAVRVFYTTLAGAPRSVLVTAPNDPLARFGDTNEYQYDLSASYDKDDIPTAVGNALIARLSQQRVVGTVTVLPGRFIKTGNLWTASGPPKGRIIGHYDESHYTILPGDLAHLEPYPKLPPQRIVGVRLHALDVEVEFGEDVEAVSAGKVLARLAGGRARAKRRLVKKGK